MRLIQITRHRFGGRSLSRTAELAEDRIPQYAILSHTWAIDNNEEVQFSDLSSTDAIKRAKSKPGFRKLKFCMRQAERDGSDYFWVDSCCINRDSDAELGLSIRSMFRWYHKARKCYVYMPDVRLADAPAQQPVVESFIYNRWFTRGWTVQELLAPREVEFFDVDGERLGNYLQYEAQISRRTKIPERALQGANMSEFSFQDRLSWFDDRETTRDEDMIYAAFGLFNVHLPVMYGEGLDHARRRLAFELQIKESAFSPSQHTARSRANAYGNLVSLSAQIKTGMIIGVIFYFFLSLLRKVIKHYSYILGGTVVSPIAEFLNVLYLPASFALGILDALVNVLNLMIVTGYTILLLALISAATAEWQDHIYRFRQRVLLSRQGYGYTADQHSNEGGYDDWNGP